MKLTTLSWVTIATLCTTLSFALARGLPHSPRDMVAHLTALPPVPGHEPTSCDAASVQHEILAAHKESSPVQPSMDALRDSLGCTWSTPMPFGDVFPSFNLQEQGRDLAIAWADHGRSDEAAMALLDLWALGQDLGRGSLVQTMVGLSLQTEALHALTKLAPSLSDPTRADAYLAAVQLAGRYPTPDLRLEEDAGGPEMVARIGERPLLERWMWWWGRDDMRLAAARVEAMLAMPAAQRMVHAGTLSTHATWWERATRQDTLARGIIQVGKDAATALTRYEQARARALVALAVGSTCPSTLEGRLDPMPIDPLTGARVTWDPVACDVVLAEGTFARK